MLPQRRRLLFRAPFALVFQTQAVTPSTYDPSWTFAAGGGPVTVDYGDNTGRASSATGVSYTYANAGTKVVRITAPDFAKLTAWDNNTDGMVGRLPSFATCTALTGFYVYQNQFTGALPSFATCTALTDFRCDTNQFTGALPSFATCTALTGFGCYTNQFTGALPSFATCTALTGFRCYTNQFTDYEVGSFVTQKSLNTLNLSSNLLSQAAVDAILADCVASLGGGRVACTLSLQTGNAAPSAQGTTDKGTLVAAGWTVTTS